MNHPEVNIVVNTTNEPIEVSLKDSAYVKTIILAPGEGKIPSNIMRVVDFDVKAFPLLHPSGKYGLHFVRIITITKKEYFKARLYHHSGLFANNNDYLFMSQQYLERDTLEGQINISMQKGVMSEGPDGTKTMKLSDAFSVFKQVPGTPKFWQQKRYNLLAMINVLGPFQWFFTFSCAELRWPSIIACLLRKRGHKVKVLDYLADTANAAIEVDNQPLKEFLSKTGQTLRGIIQKDTFTVTRIFDQRVKSFIKNILMDQGEKRRKV